MEQPFEKHLNESCDSCNNKQSLLDYLINITIF